MAMNDEPAAVVIDHLKTVLGGYLIHDNLDLIIRQGEVLALVGGSGTGKTTLLRQILMLETSAAGSIRVFDQEITHLGRRGKAKLSRRFGMLFQGGALFSSLTVRENVLVPLREHTSLPLAFCREIADLKIFLAGLPAEAGNKYPSELSGGMVKRAALARALALDPDLLFLDEPSAGLDPVSANALDELIVQLKQSLGLTVIMVTHDLDSLWRVTDRVAFLGEKRVLECKPIAELCQSEHPLIQHYFSGPRGRAAGQAART